jgi:hypothetical protein
MWLVRGRGEERRGEERRGEVNKGLCWGDLGEREQLEDLGVE